MRHRAQSKRKRSLKFDDVDESLNIWLKQKGQQNARLNSSQLPYKAIQPLFCNDGNSDGILFQTGKSLLSTTGGIRLRSRPPKVSHFAASRGPRP